MLYTLLIILLIVEYIYLTIMLFGVEPISYYVACRLGFYGVKTIELNDYVTNDYRVLGYYDIQYYNNIFWESYECIYDNDNDDDDDDTGYGYLMERYIKPLVIYHTDSFGYQTVYGNYMYLIGIPKIKNCIDYILENIEYIVFYGC